MTYISKVIAKEPLNKFKLNWLSYDGEDFQDALEHCDTMVRRTTLKKGLGDVKEVREKMVAPEKILKSFNGKEKGWLLKIPQEKWEEEFRKVYGRDIKKILELSAGEEGIPAVIIINDMLCDGFARTQLAHALNEKVNAVYFKEKE